MTPLEKIFSGLVLYRHNLQCLHWNIVGKRFDSDHKLLGEYADKVHEYVDEVAEILKIQGQRPMCLDCILKSAKEDTETEYLCLECDKDYESEDAWKYVNVMFNHLIQLYNEACATELSGDIISKLQEEQYWFRLECQYKGNARLTD